MSTADSCPTASESPPISRFDAYFYEGPWDGYMQFLPSTLVGQQAPPLVAIECTEMRDFYECLDDYPVDDAGTQRLDFYFLRTDRLFSREFVYATHLWHSTIRFAALGCTNFEISRMLGLPQRDVLNLRRAAMRRYSCHTSVDLYRAALRNEIIEPTDRLTYAELDDIRRVRAERHVLLLAPELIPVPNAETAEPLNRIAELRSGQQLPSALAG